MYLDTTYVNSLSTHIAARILFEGKVLLFTYIDKSTIPNFKHFLDPDFIYGCLFFKFDLV